uniref:Calmodulin-lysine N-methyltransferase n=1 Tax=Opuntia streptacantha TaxID=393608 RepID=A0A7C9CHN1_OPUST
MEEQGEAAQPVPNRRPSSLRWRILRRALLRSRRSDEQLEAMMSKVSRKAKQGFNLIPCQLMDLAHHHDQVEVDSDSCSNSSISRGLSGACFRYSLPAENSPHLLLFQRRDSCTNINDFEICNKYDIDNTGLVCPWPSEEILSYYCLLHADMFSTFFKQFHKGLVRTVNFLLKGSAPSEAIFFSPKRGDSLDKFLEEVKESGLHFSISEKYDDRIWKRHQELSKGDESWPNYDADHCYPLLIKISR